MKKKSQVVLNLHGLSVPDKIEEIEKVITAMTDNANFPSAGEYLRELGLSVKKLRTDYKSASDKRAVAVTHTAILNQQESVVDSQYTALGRHVEAESKGDEAKIKSAGMDIKATATPIGIPLRPEYLKSIEGKNTGSIGLKWKAVRGARSYVVRMTDTIAEMNSWKQMVIVTKASAIVEGLTSGTQYWFQVSPIGAAGQGPWSDPTTKVAP